MSQSTRELEPAELPVNPGGRLARVAFALALAGALVGVTLIYLIAGALSGVWRTVALAILTPILVLSILALWRAAHAVSKIGARRARLVSAYQARGTLGVLARPELGEWEGRLQRSMLLPAGATLRAVGPENIESETGQARLHELYLLLGQVRRPDEPLPLPPRATLVLVDAERPLVRLWDLSAFFERADAGDEAALDGLAELEAHVQGLVGPAVQRALSAQEQPR